jgi:predicted  nucleic acid-binding Zn-ribbon protein
VSKHEDVLRQTLRFYREHAPANCKEANAIDAVLAEVESLREQLAEAIHENVKLSVERVEMAKQLVEADESAAMYQRQRLAAEAEVESLRAERDEASRALSGVLEAADASRMVLIEQVKSAVARIEALQAERGKARDAAISLAARLEEAQRIINDRQERGNEMLARAERAEERVAYRDRHVVPALTRERDSLSCSLSNVEDELRQAGMGCVGPTYLRVLNLRQRAERLEAALEHYRNMRDANGRWTAELALSGSVSEALAHSAPEPRRVCVACRKELHLHAADGECPSGASAPEPTQRIHPPGWTGAGETWDEPAPPSPAPRYDEVYFAGVAHMDAQARGEACDPLTDASPAPAPTERVCRCGLNDPKQQICGKYNPSMQGEWCIDCVHGEECHDRACHTGEQR